MAANRRLIRLEAAYLLAITSAAMLQVCLLVEAFSQAGAPGVAAITAAQAVPAVVAVPLLAGLGDRIPRRSVLITSLVIATASVVGVLAVLLLWPSLVLLAVLAASFAAAAGVAWALVGALLPMLAGTPEELVAANATSTTMEGAGGLVGPLVAAVLLGAGGTAAVTIGAATTMALATGLAFGIPAEAPGAILHRAGRRVARDLLVTASAGARTLAQLPAPRLITLVMFIQWVVRGALTVLLVVLAIDLLDLGEAGVGVLAAATGLGGLIGSALAAGFARDRDLGPLLGWSAFSWGIPLMVLAVATSTPAAILLLAAGGIAGAVVDIAGFGLLQGTVPDRARTGAMGAIEGVVALGIAAGSVLGSLLLTVVDPRLAILVVGLLLPMMVAVRWRRLATLDRFVLVPRAQIHVLRGCRIFAPLSLAQLEQLAAGCVEVSVPAGATIIREGEPGDAFYLILDGEVEVRREDRLLRTLVGGGWFGEIALLRNVPRTATVIAVTSTRLARIDRGTFVGAITANATSRLAAIEVAQAYEP